MINLMNHKATDQFSGKKDGVYRMLTNNLIESLGWIRITNIRMIKFAAECQYFHKDLLKRKKPWKIQGF